MSRSLRDDDRAVMQVVEAMLALSILILAITWSVTVSQRPSESPVESDELRTLTRQAFELMDAVDTPGQTDTVAEHLSNCGQEGRLAEQLLDAIGDANVNLYIEADPEPIWVASARSTETGPESLDEAMSTGLVTQVVRYLTETDLCGDGTGEAIFALRAEVWRA